MQTDTICAFQLEENDYFVEKGEHFQVKSLDRDDDYMDFTVIETATGDTYPMAFAPFDTITLVTSFEDESVTVEDIEVDI